MKQIPAWKTAMVKALGVLAALLCFVVFMPSAHAEEARINITASPSELESDGMVTFTFEINNYNTDYPMTDVMIQYNGTSYDVLNGMSIEPGHQASNITLSLNVTASQLGKPIVFTVMWNRNGEPMSQQAQITVAQAENPVISMTRTADKTNARTGDKITITYTIKNTTKFDMTDIMLIDEQLSDKPIFQNETLRASSTTSRDFTYTMGDESVTSTPLVTYTVNGKTKTFSSVDPLELTMVLVQLDFTVLEGTPTPSGVSFSFDVKNTGTQEISDITVSDERENPVNETPFTLAPGESTTLSYLIVPLMTEPLRNVQFKLAGTDPFGEAYTLEPEDVYEVYPYVDASQISVTVRAETVTPWSAESGKVSARIVITNHSSVELTNITISEATIGVIKNYETLPAGETSFDQDIVLGSPRNLSFTVKGYDPTGTNRELASCVMPVAYGTEITPEATATPEASGGNLSIFNGISSGITKILVVLGVLMVLSFIILVVLTVMERAKTSRWEDDEADDDFDDQFFEEPPKKAERATYQSAPDPEEISYTKRMLAMKDEAQAGTVNSEPVRLPLPPAEPARSSQRTLQPPREQKQRADEVADRLVQTAQSRYSEAESRAEYRPAGEPAPAVEQKPMQTARSAPHPKQTAQVAAPRVFDYKKQPKQQPRQKQAVTRIRASYTAKNEDEEY